MIIISNSLFTFLCPIIVLVLLFIGNGRKFKLSEKETILITSIIGIIAGYTFSPVLYKSSILTSFIVSFYQVLSAIGIFYLFKLFIKK